MFQVRLESIEAVNKILEESNKRIQPTGTGVIPLCILFKINETTALSITIALVSLPLAVGSEAVYAAHGASSISFVLCLRFCLQR